MLDISKTVHAFVVENFKQESYFGTPWPDLAESTKAERKRAGTWPGKMLRRSEAGLFGSLLYGVESDLTGFVGVGANIFYAKWLQEGTKKMSARPFLPESMHPDIMEEIVELFVGNKVNKYFEKWSRKWSR